MGDLDPAWFDLRILCFAPGAKRRARVEGRESAGYHYECLELAGVYANGRPALVVHGVGGWGTGTPTPERTPATVNLVNGDLPVDCFLFRTDVIRRSVLLRRLLRRPFFESVGGAVASGMVDDYARTWRLLRAEDGRPVHVAQGLRATLAADNEKRLERWTIDFEAGETAAMLADPVVRPVAGSGRWKSGGKLKRPIGANRR